MTAACLLVLANNLWAQDRAAPPPAEEADHAIVFEFGAAGEWSRGEAFQPGGTFAFEVMPIEHWLEIEVGIAATAAPGHTEMPIDMLFKKPWAISRTFEFMAGIGPEIIHATGRAADTYWGISTVADFMFWPRRNVGWYAEPGVDVVFQRGERRASFGVAAGVLIGR
jgi:hypothetical protein